LNILIVTFTCPTRFPDPFNPPSDRYEFAHRECDPLTNDRDANEAGQMLRFFHDSYDQLSGKKLFFVHGHDGGKHIPGRETYWSLIDRLVQTRYFWERQFGSLVRGSVMKSLRFRTTGNGTFAETNEDVPFLNATDFVKFIFENTSLQNVPSAS
jgi:hypothetical protein